MSKNSLAFVIPKELRGERLDRVLEKLVTDRTRSQLQKLVRRGGISIEGNPVRRSNIRVRGGERLTVETTGFGAQSADSSRSSGASLEILFEDEQLIAVDKPPGLLTHDAPGSPDKSLASLLVERFGPLPTSRGEDRPGIVHRLDRETSGVIIAARDERTMDALAGQFRAREVEKRYTALVHGTPPDAHFEVDLPLEPQPGRGDREQVAPPGEGKAASTEFQLDQGFGEISLLSCFPRTGRRHQIRVHAAEAGFPVLFDKLYRRSDRAVLPEGAPLLRRHALHASELTIIHPATGKKLKLCAPLPPDFGTLLRWLENHHNR